ncbi:Uncharacterised protein [Mycobacteroides abscessus subsp. abscessus]|nr:Uncharacterised protein [Mycobacteroides abscessus subsp. abscessus]
MSKNAGQLHFSKRMDHIAVQQNSIISAKCAYFHQWLDGPDLGIAVLNDSQHCIFPYSSFKVGNSDSSFFIKRQECYITAFFLKPPECTVDRRMLCLACYDVLSFLFRSRKQCMDGKEISLASPASRHL